MHAETQDVEHGRVESLGRTVRGDGDDGIPGSLLPQGSIGQLRRERCVRRTQLCPGDGCRQDEIRVRIGVMDRAQSVERDPPGRQCTAHAVAPLAPGDGSPALPVSNWSSLSRVPRHQSPASIAGLPAGWTRCSAIG